MIMRKRKEVCVYEYECAGYCISDQPTYREMNIKGKNWFFDKGQNPVAQIDRWNNKNKSEQTGDDDQCLGLENK